MQSENKRITKNAIMLTLRSILVAIIGLYTSRVVLQVLGVEDYGIFGIIGGIIGMTTFLNTAMSSATSRFITFELGSGNFEKLNEIFSTALRIHIFIALFVVIIGETVGLWYLNNKMVIPEGRMFAAQVLYQFTVFSVLISFTQVPYGAVIMAHEKMSIYAYFEIIFVVLKLAIVYVLLVTEDHRLILYGALSFAVSISKALFYRIYCIRHFPESKAFKEFNKNIAKTMVTYSGFDLYGNICVVARNQGQPLVLNLFYGVIANAGASIASTVNSTISSLTANIITAFRPQIIKQYAQDNVVRMSELLKRAVQFTLLAFSIITIPFIIETPRILNIWLGQDPPYSVSFIRWILVSQLIFIGISINANAIHATGNVKSISFVSGSFYLLSLFFTYIALKMGMIAQIVYIINAIMNIIILFSGWFFIKKQIPSIPTLFIPITYIKSFIIIIFSGFIVWEIRNLFIPSNFNDFSALQNLSFVAMTTFISIIILLSLYPFLALNKIERQYLINLIKKFFSKYNLIKNKKKLNFSIRQDN